jgi:23S rRNA (uracil1939-C5)-methyltransferase
VVERLEVVALGHRGDGVARDAASGEAIYVPGALPGEIVEVDSVAGHPDRRQLIRVDRASTERIAPICPHFGQCGGCAVQHYDAAPYRAWKRGLVFEALRQAGLDAPVGDLIDAHGDGRRRAVFHARRGGRDVLEVGFAAARSHRVVAIDRCPVLTKSLDGAVNAAWAIAEALGPTDKPLDIHVTATDSGLDIDVRGSGPLRPAMTAALAQIAAKYGLARLTRHGELIVQHRVPALRIGKATVNLPPAAFLQATALGEATLARLIADAAGSAARIADLFAGLGPFTLRLAERARVTAVDDDALALAALARAATAPGLKPIAVERRDLFRRPLTPPELKDFDAVIFDPPRQGGEAQARELAISRVAVIVAVSCNPSTFARDIGILTSAGYRLGTVTPVDQFRYSPHVELVARLQRGAA